MIWVQAELITTLKHHSSTKKITIAKVKCQNLITGVAIKAAAAASNVVLIFLVKWRAVDD